MEKCTFSIVTQKYLVCSEKILNNMISNMSNIRINDSVYPTTRLLLNFLKNCLNILPIYVFRRQHRK